MIILTVASAFKQTADKALQWQYRELWENMSEKGSAYVKSP